jgi:ubiquinone/menaquinone biosynthesis C-methylase UbiE
MEKIREVYDFYNSGAEMGRLDRGLGKIEFCRTKEILSSYLSGKKIVYDVGGGIGIYSSLLAGLGHQVHLLELAPSAVEYAHKHQNINHPYITEACDARHINRMDESADIVLLMGPLYHLQNFEDRIQVIKEAYRVLKKGGLLFTTGISKFSSTTWALSTYGKENECLDDPVYQAMIQEEITSGKHNKPKEYPHFIAKAFFHTPNQLQEELEDVGFHTIRKCAIGGIVWFTPSLDEKWENKASREILLKIIKMTESEDSVMGMSPHFMVVSKKKLQSKNYSF